MVKVNIISRSTLEWTRDRAGEIPRAHRNFDPKFNPLMKQTEYVRAVRAAKLDQMFAKPFVGAMSGHHDTVQTISCDPTTLSNVVSGGHDGEVVIWDTLTYKAKRTFMAHRNTVEGTVYTPDGVAFLTCSRDKLVKVWDTDFSELIEAESNEVQPIATYNGVGQFTDIDHHWQKNWFATAGNSVEIWDINRTRPIQTFNWGDDVVSKCAFNKIETDLVCCSMEDRGVAVYDTRSATAHSKLIMEVRCGSLRWSPMDPNLFVAGSDDWNVYLFDLRVPGRPRNVYQGPVHSVTSVDFSPTGQYICAGATDNTVRIWDINQTVKSNSLEMFHTKRMAKVTAVRFSLDNNYIFSGSEDAIVRIWKCDRSRPVRMLRGSEHHQFNYMRNLKEQYKGFDEVKRIVNQRNTPKAIRKLQFKKRKIQQRAMVKEMAKKKSNDLKPLAKKKVIQALK
jgi:WD repeat and SOF domain-containing protein 1